MSQGPRPPKSTSRLPESGLAEDILKQWKARETSAQEARESEPLAAGGRPDPSGPDLSGSDLSGPDRVFAFADRLAQRRPAAQEHEEPESWVTFELAGELFALPVSYVEEVQRISSISKVPFTPAPIRGITHVRGQVLAVVDLRVRLGLPAADLSPDSRLIIVEARQRSLGLLVDAARQIEKVLPSRILPTPADIRNVQTDFLRGVYPREHDLLILLELDRVLWVPGEVAAALGAADAGDAVDRPTVEV